MKPPPISFDLETTELVFWPETEQNAVIRTTLQKAMPIDFCLTCHGRANNFQLNSDFDSAFQNRLEASGYIPTQLSVPSDLKKEYDFAFDFHGQIVVFEIEKANWEKIFYDLFKAHIYLQSGAESFVLMLPLTWAHAHGEKELFHVARTRIEQSRRFGFGKQEVFEKVLLVGFNQSYQGKPFTEDVRKDLRRSCEVHFAQVIQ